MRAFILFICICLTLATRGAATPAAFVAPHCPPEAPATATPAMG
ncbi:hypothetical protein [Marinibacterium sp. SX1]